jgi:hypothetical protein
MPRNRLSSKALLAAALLPGLAAALLLGVRRAAKGVTEGGRPAPPAILLAAAGEGGAQEAMPRPAAEQLTAAGLARQFLDDPAAARRKYLRGDAPPVVGVIGAAAGVAGREVTLETGALLKVVLRSSRPLDQRDSGASGTGRVASYDEAAGVVVVDCDEVEFMRWAGD